MPLMRLLPFLALCLLALPAKADEKWPQRPVRIVVPFAAGGSIDVVARIVADHMAEKLGQPMVIENKPGAGSTIGVDAVAKAAPDGYTLLVNGAAQSVIPALYPNAPFDARKDLAPVSMLGRMPFVLAVNKALPVTDYQSFVAYMKANPGKVDFGTAGPGSASHLASELFKKHTGVNFVLVAYRGTPAAVNDLVSGQLGFMIDAQSLLAQHVAAGTLRGFATTGLTRSRLLPDLPTLDELGLKGFEVTSWQAMYVPAGTPKPIVDRLAGVAATAMADPKVQERFARAGVEPPSDLGPENLQRFLAAETEKWGTIIKEAGVTVN